MPCNADPSIRAHAFTLIRCDNGGLHLIALDKNENPICDIALPRAGLPSFIKTLQDFLYVEAVERDDG